MHERRKKRRAHNLFPMRVGPSVGMLVYQPMITRWAKRKERDYARRNFHRGIIE